MERGDQIAVVAQWSWPDPFDGVSVSHLRAVQNKIAAGEWCENAQAKTWAGLAVAEVLELDLSDKAVRSKVKALLKRWTENGMFKVVNRPDANGDDRPFLEVGEWA